MENQEQTVAAKEMRLVPTDSVNAILKYLSARPYIEVMNFIPLLVGSQIAPGTTPEPTLASPPPPAAE